METLPFENRNWKRDVIIISWSPGSLPAVKDTHDAAFSVSSVHAACTQ